MKFQWQFNSAGDAGAIDDVRILGAAIAVEATNRRGDSNADGAADLSDAAAILGSLFLGGTLNAAGTRRTSTTTGRWTSPIR